MESSLQAEPENEELSALKDELNELISLTKQSIADLQPAEPAKPAAPPASTKAAAAAPGKGSGVSPPGAPETKQQQKQQQVPNPDAQTTKPQPPAAAVVQPQIPAYAVNDNVLARWVQGDNAFYPARILSITGSATNPIYVVVFKSYGDRESVSAKDIKPMANAATANNNTDNSNSSNIPGSQKRKADGMAPGSFATTPTTAAAGGGAQNAPNVISAAASIDPSLADQQRQDKKNVNDQEGSGNRRPAKTRKLKANKELEVGKTKWQEFASKGKLGKGLKKESMFRTGEGPNSRGMLRCWDWGLG